MPSRHSKDAIRHAREDSYRKLIFQVAEHLFASKGVDDINIPDIAVEAGFSKTGLYNLFNSKSTLLQALYCARGREAAELHAGASVAATTPLNGVLSCVQPCIEFAVRHPDYLCLHWGAGCVPDILHPCAGTKNDSSGWDELIEKQTRFFQQGIEEGVFCSVDPRLMARLSLSMNQVMLADWVDQDMKLDRNELAESMQRLLKRAFCCAGTSQLTSPLP